MGRLRIDGEVSKLEFLLLASGQASRPDRGSVGEAGQSNLRRIYNRGLRTYPFKTSIRSRIRAWASSSDIPDGSRVLDSASPLCRSIASSRFRFAGSVPEVDAGSTCAGGLRTPFVEAMARLVVGAGRYLNFGCLLLRVVATSRTHDRQTRKRCDQG
jgi:hypothetical protein